MDQSTFNRMISGSLLAIANAITQLRAMQAAEPKLMEDLSHDENFPFPIHLAQQIVERCTNLSTKLMLLNVNSMERQEAIDTIFKAAMAKSVPKNKDFV